MVIVDDDADAAAATKEEEEDERACFLAAGTVGTLRESAKEAATGAEARATAATEALRATDVAAEDDEQRAAIEEFMVSFSFFVFFSWLRRRRRKKRERERVNFLLCYFPFFFPCASLSFERESKALFLSFLFLFFLAKERKKECPGTHRLHREVPTELRLSLSNSSRVRASSCEKRNICFDEHRFFSSFFSIAQQQQQHQKKRLRKHLKFLSAHAASRLSIVSLSLLM